jgi:drug/metabolite transporter (DMT)-like permease
VNARKVAGLVLILVGVLALVYRGFDYTKEDTRARLGPVELSVKQKERVTVPVWAGVAAVAVGAVLLVTARK